MYYSAIDQDTHQVLSCGINSYSTNEIRHSVIRYVRKFIESKRDLNIIENSNLSDISDLYRFKILKHKNFLTNVTRIESFKDVLENMYV